MKSSKIMNDDNPYKKVFYGMYQNGQSVEANNAAPIKKQVLTNLVKTVGECDQNFIGFIDETDTILQFFVDKVNDIWVEIPEVKKKGSYSKRINQIEMESIITNLKTPFKEYKTRLELDFKAW